MWKACSPRRAFDRLAPMNIFANEPSSDGPDSQSPTAGRTCHFCGRVITDAMEPAAVVVSADYAVCDDPNCHEAAFHGAQDDVAQAFTAMNEAIARQYPDATSETKPPPK